MVVCSLHFKASAFLRPGYLRHNAVPTVLAPEETTRGEVSSESCTVSAVANGRSSPAPPTYRYPGRSDSQSSCGIPDDQSSEMELSLEEGRSSLSSSSCTSSSRPDSESSCGIPDDQSSEIGLSLEEEGCSSASWDHTYSCLPLENSPLEAHGK
ncbi:uncharacterized protein LOC115322869 [Ixodes scapularis]|uniref:uncharacterized protein LOC115322869 n=1 Tax=Ixodes scapularis TaxID=6945 RepID=UPI001A9E86C9|nr:uncharacterized protein LOC115322869 [Ixodes scapularis]